MVAKQTKELATQCIKGTKSLVSRAEKKLALAKSSDPFVLVGDGDLPLTRGLIGSSIDNLADIGQVLACTQSLISSPPDRRLWLPYLGETLDAGIAALLAMEILEHLGLAAVSRRSGSSLDTLEDVVKIHGAKMLEGASAVLLLGAAQSSELAAELVREIKQRHAYVFMAGSHKGNTFAKQLQAEGTALGWGQGLIPLGSSTSSVVHALGFFVRIALSAGLRAGEAREILQFVKDKIFAFVMVLGEPDNEKYAVIAGAASFGIQSVAEFYIPQLLPIYPLA